jgi:hypothetical protein
MKRGIRSVLGGYKSYNFKDHDPVLDQIDRLYELAGVLTPNGVPRYTHIEEISGLRQGTLRNWRMRKVKRPQHAATKGLIRALGGDYVVVFRGKQILPGRLVSEQVRIAEKIKLKAERKRKKAA